MLSGRNLISAVVSDQKIFCITHYTIQNVISSKILVGLKCFENMLTDVTGFPIHLCRKGGHLRENTRVYYT